MSDISPKTSNPEAISVPKPAKGTPLVIQSIAKNGIEIKLTKLGKEIFLTYSKPRNLHATEHIDKNESFWVGFDFACQLLEDMGYCKTSTHPYNIADCLKGKMGRIPKNKIRKNIIKE